MGILNITINVRRLCMLRAEKEKEDVALSMEGANRY